MEGIINLMKTAEEYCIEQDETAMNESASVPDTREPESDASSMVGEEDSAIYAVSDVEGNEPHQQGFNSQVDIPQNGESSAEEDAHDLSYESSLINEG